MKEADISNKQRKLVKRKLPPGTSEYQVCNAINESVPFFFLSKLKMASSI